MTARMQLCDETAKKKVERSQRDCVPAKFSSCPDGQSTGGQKKSAKIDVEILENVQINHTAVKIAFSNIFNCENRICKGPV